MRRIETVEDLIEALRGMDPKQRVRVLYPPIPQEEDEEPGTPLPIIVGERTIDRITRVWIEPDEG